MSLTFNIRHLENKDLHLEGDLPTAELELDLQDEMIRPAATLQYDFDVQKIEGSALVRGEIHLPVEYTCVRCLKKFQRPLTLPDWTCHLPLSGEDKVDVSNDLVNLTPY